MERILEEIPVVSDTTGLREKGHETSLPLCCLDDPESSLKRVFWMLSLPARPAHVPGLLGLAVAADCTFFPFLAH